MNELKRTKEWFEHAIPAPTDEHRCIQIGCHYEEVSEMMFALGDGEDHSVVSDTAEYYKAQKGLYPNAVNGMQPDEKIDLLDSLADQITTAVGIAHMFGFDIEGALAEVNRSNFSKFEDGKPVFDKNGKITKGKNYSKPQLAQFIGNK